MSVRLRMKRMGSTHRPFYRLTAVDQRRKRDGRVLEELGWYNPLAKEVKDQSVLKTDRIAYWLSVGAQPSRTVTMLIKKHGLKADSGTQVADQHLARLPPNLTMESRNAILVKLNLAFPGAADQQRRVLDLVAFAEGLAANDDDRN